MRWAPRPAQATGRGQAWGLQLRKAAGQLSGGRPDDLVGSKTQGPARFAYAGTHSSGDGQKGALSRLHYHARGRGNGRGVELGCRRRNLQLRDAAGVCVSSRVASRRCCDLGQRDDDASAGTVRPDGAPIDEADDDLSVPRTPYRPRRLSRSGGGNGVTGATERDFELGLLEKAKRVLPGGTFGNLPGDVGIREARRGGGPCPRDGE